MSRVVRAVDPRRSGGRRVVARFVSRFPLGRGQVHQRGLPAVRHGVGRRRVVRVCVEVAMTTAVHQATGAGWPDLLTVEQAAAIVRIGRTSAYGLARFYIATGGADGRPAIRIGKQLRVPRAQLERWHGGPLTPPVAPPRITTASSTTRSRRVSRPVQSSLPFSACGPAMTTTRSLSWHRAGRPRAPVGSQPRRGPQPAPASPYREHPGEWHRDRPLNP